MGTGWFRRQAALVVVGTVVAAGTQKLTPGLVVSPKPYAGGEPARQ